MNKTIKLLSGVGDKIGKLGVKQIL